MSSHYINTTIQQNITIPSNQLNENIDDMILDKIKDKIGNRCIKDGYVNRDTIKILSRTFGKINTSHFNGNIKFEVLLSVDICNPLEGEKTRCKVISINKMGILAENNPLTIVIARQHHSDKSDLDNIHIGDTIEATIIAKRFELYDDKITVICQL